MNNNISLDGSTVDYGRCGTTPSFYMSIIDNSCTAWGPNWGSENTENNFGNYNNNGVCRFCVEYRFVYQLTDAVHLTYTDSLLNYWIPENHAVMIYTPLGYDFMLLNTITPQLACY